MFHQRQQPRVPWTLTAVLPDSPAWRWNRKRKPCRIHWTVAPLVLSSVSRLPFRLKSHVLLRSHPHPSHPRHSHPRSSHPALLTPAILTPAILTPPFSPPPFSPPLFSPPPFSPPPFSPRPSHPHSSRPRHSHPRPSHPALLTPAQTPQRDVKCPTPFASLGATGNPSGSLQGGVFLTGILLWLV